MTSTTMASDLAREALEPFAKIAEHDIGTDEADTDFFQPMVRYNSAPRLTVGDLRRARTAYDAIGSGVKALEWANIGRCVGWTAEDEQTHLYYAKGLDRLYEVARGRVGWWAKWQGAFHAKELPSLEEAKAAAQADFERRVLSCLSTHTAAGAGPVGEAVAWLTKQDHGSGLRIVTEGWVPDIGWSAPFPAYARPVEEPGEVERRELARIDRIHERAFNDGYRHGNAVASARAETAEAALAKTREHLEKRANYLEGLVRDAVGLVPPAYPNWHRDARAALTGDAQEAGE